MYVRAKVGSKATAKTYFSSKGIRLEVRNIEKFASLLEEIFINTEFVSRLIGWLGNHDLRRSLLIASQIITSPTLGIDKLVVLALSDGTVNIRRFDIMRALLLGKYKRFNSAENEYVFNIFDLPPFVTTSPLLMVRILSMLQAIFLAAGDDLERKYIASSDVVSFFEPMGVDDRHVTWAIERMVERRLVEPYNPSQDWFNDATRIAITDPGRIHLEFAESDSVYLEQTALVTGVRANDVCQSIRTATESKNLDNRTRCFQARKEFTQYLLKEDLVKITVPESTLYASQKTLNEQLSRRWAAIGS